MLFPAIFHVFCFVLNFRDFSVFSVLRKICHSKIGIELRVWLGLGFMIGCSSKTYYPHH